MDWSFWDVLWTTFVIFVWAMFLVILINVLIDLFRSRDLNGWKKAIWVLVLVVLPLLGVLIYLIARGGKMAQHNIDAAKAQDAAMKDYIRQASGGGTADELERLSGLKDKGVITQAEFDAQKAKLLG